MSYSDFLTPRPEVLTEEGIEGIIDLANLSDPRKRKIEANSQLFFSVTYPTADIRRVIRALDERFAGKGDAPGLFLFEGLKGSGKSHLLLLIYHLFSSPRVAKNWLEQHGLTCLLPSDATVIVNKFTDLPLYSIWSFIFEKVTGRLPERSIVQPGLERVEKVLAGRRVILIFDELEQGIRVIGDPAVKAQNVAFLQLLSEWANRSDQVTLFASIYSDQEEPGSTLKRVPSCRVQFAHAGDRAKVVLHRLFKNYLDFDPASVSSVIESYLNVWKRHITFGVEDYRSQLLVTYPFLPELLDLILNRVPVRGGFQNVRGALGFLANLVRLTHGKTDFITAAHATLRDREVTTRLADLDTSGELVAKAYSNLEELKDQPLASEIVAATMLYTLTGTGRLVGATREELLKHTLEPIVDINNFERTLLAFQKYAAYFHPREGRYYFDTEENADAKVEFRSLPVPDGKAREFLHNLWRDEIFREPNSVVFTDVETTKQALSTLASDRLRYVLTPRRLSPAERHDLFYGIPVRNQVILLEPRDKNFNLDTHPDLLKWAKRCLAARDLSDTAQDAERRADYDRISREDKKNCIDAIRRAGLIFIRWEVYGARPEEDQIEEEALTGVSKDEVLTTLNQKLFPPQLFEEHLGQRLSELIQRTVKDIDKEYRATLGFPVPATVRSVSAAIRSLCSNRRIGIRHPRGDFCGQNPQLTETELFEATADAPFEAGKVIGLPSAPPPPPRPVVDEKEGGEVEIGPILVPSVKKESIRTQPCSGPAALQQEVAARLQQYPGAKTIGVRLTIYLDQTIGDLSSLPPSLRGNLSGPGALTAEITVTKEGEFSKVQVEQMIEALPSIPKADYTAELILALPVQEEERPHA